MTTNIKDFKLLAEKFTELDQRIESYNKNLENKITILEEELEKTNKELADARRIVDSLPEDIHNSLQILADSCVNSMKPSLIQYIKSYCDEIYIKLRTG